jgi:glycosyltransferase EpsD
MAGGLTISPGLETGDVDTQYDVDITRSPFSVKNLAAYGKIKKIIDENRYDIVHCHTPVGGVLGRLCSLAARKKGTVVIYTCHGFHFYRGSSRLSWLAYYPVEKWLSRFTDCIVTINNEDFTLARCKLHCKNVFKINGVGVNLSRFKPVGNDEKTRLRSHYGFNRDDFIVIYVGQFTHDKNHDLLLRQISCLSKNIKQLRILLVGGGNNKYAERCKKFVMDNSIQQIVNLMGYRTDIQKLYVLSDILISVSIREGLPQNIVEGMASGLPVVCSNIRGHVDVVRHEVNGFLFPLDKPEEMTGFICRLYEDKELRRKIANQNVIDAEKFSVNASVTDMAKIYERFM